MNKDNENVLKTMTHNYDLLNNLISIVKDMISDERFSSETKNILFKYRLEFIDNGIELLKGLNEVNYYLIEDAMKKWF